MKITYSIQVCNESRELFSLVNFILKVKDAEDNLNIVVDSLHVTDKVRLVLEYFKDRTTVYERPFDSFYNSDAPLLFLFILYDGILKFYYYSSVNSFIS